MNNYSFYSTVEMFLVIQILYGDRFQHVGRGGLRRTFSFGAYFIVMHLVSLTT